MSDTESDEAADGSKEPEEGDPYCGAGRLFLACPPDPCYGDEAGGDSCLEKTEEETNGGEACEGVAGCSKH